MVGKTYLHRTRTVKLVNFKNEGEQVKIITDLREHTVEASRLELFLNEFQPIEDGVAVVQNQGVGLNPATLSTINSLREILMDNITKVRADKTYIEQSKEINSNVKSIIDLAKTEIEAIKLASGR